MTQKSFIFLLLLHAHNSQIIGIHFFQIFLQSESKSEPPELIGVATLPEVDDNFFFLLDFVRIGIVFFFMAFLLGSKINQGFSDFFLENNSSTQKHRFFSSLMSVFYAWISLYVSSRTVIYSPNVIFESWFGAKCIAENSWLGCPMTHYRVMTSLSHFFQKPVYQKPV